ncbi:MAG: hypothetical protein JRI54_13805, partial [Deltaproteobacteria bacterium]|nr:hypothetical protein [Deltaproteobacteria bacterium]
MITYTRRKFLCLGAASLTAVGFPRRGWAKTIKPNSQRSGNKMPVIRNQPEGMAQQVGARPGELDKLARLFSKMIEEGLHPGAQLAVFRNG